MPPIHRRSRASLFLVLVLGLSLFGPRLVCAEDGYELWLRYRPSDTPSAQTQLVTAGATDSPTLRAAQGELVRGLIGVSLGNAVSQDGAVIFGTPKSSPAVAALHLDLKAAGAEGYLIRAVSVDGHHATVIAANEDIGVLYGAFHFLRLLQTHQALDRVDLTSAPHIQHRILNHWDNLDESVERGYAGSSIWDWFELPDFVDPRYTDYARACASIGINGTVLTNVNASAVVLTAPYLQKAAALAQVFRPYGLRVYLSARFSAPVEIGGLNTADPLDPAVRAWWKAKADEIYRFIPDFGGFLVKANSEGQPGPQDYGRNHADGANMLADALAPHGGIVMWRAFVYSKDQPEDRAKQAYSEFKPLDGKFRDNVLLQVKNGAIDFQPREPFHPLFGAMPQTPLMLEVQLTKEYLGLNTNLAYLGTMWEETLSSDTFAQGRNSTVRKVIDGSLQGYRQTGMAGVANIGADRNWTGSTFDQANWYAFGRLAWDPGLSAEGIAEEWVRMTFSNDPAFIKPVVGMMMSSRETVVDYMTPLGLHHVMARGHHYGPGPWVAGGERADWTAVYYHRADAQGIGFDRTATGSNAVGQYSPEVAAQFASVARTPEKFLLWFHHVPWDRRLSSGRTLWDELIVDYSRGVQNVGAMRKTWASLASYVDAARFAQVSAFLEIQEKDAKWWRDASIAYFQTFSHRPLPRGYAAPEHPLAYYEDICTQFVPGDPDKGRKCLTATGEPATTTGSPIASGSEVAAPARVGASPADPASTGLPLLHPIFQDHAVLETGQPIRVWGWTVPAQTVTVSLAAATAKATADGTGRWTATLPKMEPGGPYELDVTTSGGASRKIRDVLIGYVWLCSGQSNMVLQVNRTLNSRAEIEGAHNDRIRMLTLANRISPTPLPVFASPVEWQPTTAANVPEFSAACYYFARELQKTLQAPMGLINSSWGGSTIQTWMSESALRAQGGYDEPLATLRLYASDAPAGITKWGHTWETWWRTHRPAQNSAEPWNADESRFKDWRTAPAGLGYWENWGDPQLASFDGLVWYRTTVRLTAEQAARGGKLSLGTVDEVDQTWLNGRFIGTTSGAGSARLYDIPAGVLHAGDNSVVIGALDTYAFGGVYGPSKERAIRLADGQIIPLDGTWRYQVVPNSVGAIPRAPWESVAGLTMIYNAMIAPLVPNTMRGVLWYQGESNTEDAEHYQGLLSGLMHEWRQEFATPLSFLVVQLANYGPAATAPEASGWAGVREAERLAVAKDPNAGLAVTIDIGDRYDIHPANKEELGRRLARVARHVVFHETIAPSGPIPVSARKENGHVVVTFSDVDGKLVAYGAYHPLGFELCGKEQSSCRFVEAAADGNRVVLTPVSGIDPARVRLCWANSPVCTLFDGAGLPAGPFEMKVE